MAAPGKRAILSWALYDWANSAFATTVMAGFFPLFFKQFWNAGVDPVVSTARLGFGSALAGVVIAGLAPVLGAIADRGAAKKRFLVIFALIGIAATASLALVPKGFWLPALSLYTLALIGFSGGNVFYDALLPGVAPESRLHFVSALGFSLGYLGGGVLFALNVLMAVKPALFGFSSASEAVRVSFLTVGIWWLLFALPLMLFVRERSIGGKAAGFAMVRAGLDQLRAVFSEIRERRMIFLFLLAYWFYIDGVDTIIRMAVDYGLSIGFEANDLILALLITQFTGFPCALLFGWLGQKIGAKRAILIAIGVYLFISLWGSLIREKHEFYLLAAVVGFVQGGIQSLSRSFYARLIPEGKAGEYFGFYNMLGKFAVIMGPLLIGAVQIGLRSFGISGTVVSRLGITSLALLFLAGGTLLFFVREDGSSGASAAASN
ncbi:MAG TPA: MFS transporter [Deltaproteobacteria bacterium]|jgi:UMF1 family MFS transporter|nr:MFS transporter [Deltaproteobacteria bacterium]HOI08468.1 MFS transporter [Deltaproteobacteria bacterium]